MVLPDPALLGSLLELVREARQTVAHSPLVIGICGAQASGKSTLAAAVVAVLEADGIAAATLSLDDLYLTRAERAVLARDVHQLFATRGPPGTHDIALGLATLDALAHGEPAPLPRFDKAADDRLPRENWPRPPHDCQVLLFEGWCVGARPQTPDALARPVNALERDEDPQAIWRTHANAALAGDYQRLFARIDRLVLLAAPDWDVVGQWREEAEAKLRATAPGAMDEREVRRFVQLYERLSRHIVTEMPARADLLVALDRHRSPIG